MYSAMFSEGRSNVLKYFSVHFNTEKNSLFFFLDVKKSHLLNVSFQIVHLVFIIDAVSKINTSSLHSLK